MEEKIINIICNYLKISPEGINSESRLVQDIGLSSFDVISLSFLFEKEFGVKIPDRMYVSVRTVGDIAELIEHLK